MARTKKATAAERSETIAELEDIAADARRVARRAEEKAEELAAQELPASIHVDSDDLSAEDVEELELIAVGEGELSALTARTIKMPAQKPGRSKQDYATPMELIRAVEKRFGPLVHDLAAHAQNTRCKTFYSKEQDSLKQAWHRDFPTGNLWLNPEFGNIAPFMEKCCEESLVREGLIIVLTPASVGAEWFAKHVEGCALVIPLRPRLSFDGINSYPKDCMLSLYGRDTREPQGSTIKYLSGFETWRWK